MDERLISRLTYWKSTLRGWWLSVSIFLAIWGILSNFRDDFLPPEQQDRWVMRLLLPRWYWIIIGFLVITVIAILEGSYRAYRREVTELDAACISKIQGLVRKYIRRRKRVNRKFMAERFTVGQYAKELTDANVEKGSLEDKIVMLQGEFTKLKAERDTLTSQLEEQNKYKIFLEADTELNSIESDPFEFRQSGVSLTEDTDENVLHKTNQILTTHSYNIEADFRIRFENKDLNKLVVYTVKVKLMRKTNRGKEKEIRLSRRILETQSDDRFGRAELDNLTVEGRTRTEFYWLHCDYEMHSRYGVRLNQNCFFRVTMEAMNQLPFDKDFDVDWETASKGVTPVTPRMSA
jgi:hypothetical protein